MKNCVLQMPGGGFAVVSMKVVDDLTMAGDGRAVLKTREPRYEEVHTICHALLGHRYASPAEAKEVINRAGGATERA